MSILDSILTAAGQHSGVNQEQHSNLTQAAMEMFGSGTSVSGLLHNAESQGIGHIVQSWIGTQTNEPIAAQQVENLVGPERINQLASRAGIPPAMASAALARVLPVIVDKLTPNGKLPQAA